MFYNRSYRALALVLAALLLTTTSSRADFSSAMGLYQKGDYPAALKEFTVLAGQGDADAQFILGDMYAQAQGVAQDNVQAYKWYEIAAKNGAQGAAEARDTLGTKMSADDVKKAQQLALDWRPATSSTTGNASTATTSSPTAPAESSKGGFFKNLARSVTGMTGGGTGSTSQASTSVAGIRGLDAASLAAASPDMNALQKMESYATSKVDAEGFANNVKLVAQNVPYIDTAKECAPTQTASVQSHNGPC